MALQAAKSLALGLALSPLARQEGPGVWMDPGLGDRDPVKGAVELAVAAPRVAVTAPRTRGRFKRRAAGMAGELRVGAKAPGARDLGDQLGGGELAAAGQLDEGWGVGPHALADLILKRALAAGNGRDA